MKKNNRTIIGNGIVIIVIFLMVLPGINTAEIDEDDEVLLGYGSTEGEDEYNSLPRTEGDWDAYPYVIYNNGPRDNKRGIRMTIDNLYFSDQQTTEEKTHVEVMAAYSEWDGDLLKSDFSEDANYWGSNDITINYDPTDIFDLASGNIVDYDDQWPKDEAVAVYKDDDGKFYLEIWNSKQKSWNKWNRLEICDDADYGIAVGDVVENTGAYDADGQQPDEVIIVYEKDDDLFAQIMFFYENDDDDPTYTRYYQTVDGPTRIEDIGANSNVCVIAPDLDNDGEAEPCIAWYNNDPDWYRFAIYEGGSWSGTTNVHEVHNPNGVTLVAGDFAQNGGSLELVYIWGAVSDYESKTSSNKGNTWNNFNDVDTGGSCGQGHISSTCVSESNDYALVVYEDDDDNTIETRTYYWDNGGTWNFDYHRLVDDKTNENGVDVVALYTTEGGGGVPQ